MKTKKAILLVYIIISAAFIAHAQSVITTTGAANEQITWTIGEVMVESIIRSDYGIFTQGFNQPYVTTQTAIQENQLNANNLHVYPNPATDKLYITADCFSNESSKWQLTDLTGRLVSQGSIQSGNTEIDITQIPQGEYILHFINSDVDTSTIIIRN